MTTRPLPEAIVTTPAETSSAWLESIDPDSDASRHRRRRRRRRMIATAGVAVLMVGTVVGVQSRSDPIDFRTATARRHTVFTSLDGVGQVEAISRANVAFPISGTVASVGVKPGDTVTAGQQVAELDRTQLQRSLNTARAEAAQAALELQGLIDGTSSATRGSSGTGNGAAGSATPTSASSAAATASAEVVTVSANVSTKSVTVEPSSRPGGAGTGGATSDLDTARAALLRAQQAADEAIATAQKALQTAQAVCATDGDPQATTTTSTTLPAGAAESSDTAGCEASLHAALAAQKAVAKAQKAVTAAATRYDTLIRTAATSSAESGRPTGDTDSSPPETTDRASGPSTRSGSALETGSGGDTASSASLIAGQKSVDAADATVTAAEQALDRTALLTPIAGTVVSVDLAPGDSVTADASTSQIVVAGPEGNEVTMMVPVADVPHVRVGQTASVTPDGSATALDGTVTAIGLSASTSGAETVYPVSIAVDDAGELFDGATASVAVVTATASDVVAVPTSAVATTGTRHTVRVLDGDKVSTVSVGVGTVGSTWTEITSGLEAGATVVLADLAEPLPGSATESSDGSSSSGNGRNGMSTLPSGGTFTPPSGGGFRGGR